MPRKGHIHHEDRIFIYDRDEYMCLKCRSKLLLTVDHIVPISKGGRNHVSNYQTLCRKCNCEKADQEIDYRWNEVPQIDHT